MARTRPVDFVVKLLLFDIDGTLLRCGPQVRPIFRAAMEASFGRFASLEGYAFAGKTDPQIVRDLVRDNGLSAEALHDGMTRMRADYPKRLAEGLRREGMTLLPGVVDVLRRLETRDDVTVGLLTGNWQPCAHIKLRHFDLGRYFSFGAFGEDGPHRPDLVPAALDRAHRLTGHRFTAAEAVIIGDSELDVACAQAHSVPSLAVATGFATVERLRDAGADWAFEDLVAASQALPWLAE